MEKYLPHKADYAGIIYFCKAKRKCQNDVKGFGDYKK